MPRIPDERPLRPRPDIIPALRALLPADSVLAEPAQLAPYECDGLTAYRQRPLAVALCLVPAALLPRRRHRDTATAC